MSEPVRRDFRFIIAIFLISRLGLEFVGILSAFYFPSAKTLFRGRDLQYHKPQVQSLDMWARWDSEWWLLISEKGYGNYDVFKNYGGGRYLKQETAKFFPVYPLAIRFFNLFTGNSIVSGILVSNLSAILFLYYLFKLTEKLVNPDTAFNAAILYIVFPTSLFLSAVYSESVFLAALTASFYYLERNKLSPAMIATAIAVLSRSQAVIAIPALVWLAWRCFPQKRIWAASAIVLASAIPLAGYLAFIHARFGSIIWIPESIRYWRGDLKYPLYAIVRFAESNIAIHGQHNSIIDFCFAIANLCVLVFSWRRIPRPYFLYSVLAVLFPLMSTLFSFSRLCLANVPFFVVVSFLSGNMNRAIQIFCALLLAFFMAAFANWFWVA
jgi:Gpi18-like mannosyltransferase